MKLYSSGQTCAKVSSATGFAKAGVSNTPLDSQPSLQYGFDYLTVVGVVQLAKLRDIGDFVASAFSDAWHWQLARPTRDGHKHYSNWCRSVRGGSVYWDELENEPIADLRFKIPGDMIRGADSQRDLLRVMSYLFRLGFKCTRIDPYVDDYRGIFSDVRKNIDQAWENGNNSGFRHCSERVDNRIENGVRVRRRTFYIGSRTSPSFHRIYDKYEDDIKWIRWEWEVKYGLADYLFQLAVQTFRSLTFDDDFSSIFSQLIRDSIFSSLDFKDKRDKNLDRCERLDWWQSILDVVEAQPLKLRVPVREKTMARTLAWLGNQVAPSLAMLKKFSPDAFSSFIDGLVKTGAERLRSTHYTRIDLANQLGETLDIIRVSLESLGVLNPDFLDLLGVHV